MALFKVFRGKSTDLPEIKTDGYCYFTTDDQLFYIDYKDENGEIQRAALNAGDAETVLGASLETVLNYTDEEFPTSKAILDELDKRIVQSDWSVNDESDPAHVLNRTHYEEKTHYFSVTDGGACSFVNIDVTQTYTVQIGNDVYENVPVVQGGTSNDPKAGFGGYSSDFSNYPFNIYRYPASISNNIFSGAANCIFDTSVYPNATASDVQIYQTEVHQLDPKYIKDMYYDRAVETSVVDNLSLELEVGSPGTNPFIMDIIEGCTYIVTWNDVEYECVAYIAEGPNAPSIGNGTIAETSGGNGEPFFITVFNGAVMVFTSETGTHTVSITELRHDIHQVDQKFIPNADWAQEDPNGDGYILNKPEIATDDEIIAMLMEEDMFPVVTDADGSVLADESGNILLW